ncbi:ribbon-helix-helix domain-containing protein [Paraburkholderia nemoris]|uniref:ribbon-helix-helix domain-containing protein n=1 Tax=Paraburkholderia nemoris TaxID=2793076 RepID=UPI0038BC5BC0
MERTHIFLPAPVRADLKALSQQRDVSVGELVRLAVASYLERVCTTPSRHNERGE